MGEALAREGDISANSTWTVGTLRDYFLGLIGANDRRYGEQFQHLRDLMAGHAERDIERHNHEFVALDQRFQSQQMAVASALAAAKEAVIKAENATEKRLEGVNEFRETLADQQRLLMPRLEVDVLFRSMSEKIAAQADTIKAQNERIIALAATRIGSREGWGIAVGVVGLILSILAIASFFSHVKPG